MLLDLWRRTARKYAYRNKVQTTEGGLSSARSFIFHVSNSNYLLHAALEDHLAETLSIRQQEDFEKLILCAKLIKRISDLLGPVDIHGSDSKIRYNDIISLDLDHSRTIHVVQSGSVVVTAGVGVNGLDLRSG